MSAIFGVGPAGAGGIRGSRSPGAEGARESGASPAVILPAQADSVEDARDRLESAREILEGLGGSVGRRLESAGALSARLTVEQRQALEEAGFQVVDDRPVELVPPRPALAPDLEPGFMLRPEVLETASRALESLEGEPTSGVPAASAARPDRAGEIASVAAVPPDPERAGVQATRLPWGGDPWGGRREGLFEPGIGGFRLASPPRRAEGPTDLVGPLPTTGKGVTIAIIDSGIHPHPDLADRLIGFASATDRSGRPNDPMGHGTHVAGDAAGSGRASGGRFRGPAPDANLVGIQVLGEDESQMSLSTAIENVASGIDWMVANKEKYNIRVANLSLGLPLIAQRGQSFFDFGPEVLYDPIGAAVNRAVASGIAVVAAAGNSGNGAGTIAESPAINENVITVGALDTRGTPDPSDDHVAEFSSRGPTPDGRIKPDILAPGVNIMAPNSPRSAIERQNAQMAMIREKIETLPPRHLQRLALQLAQAGMIPPQVLRLHPEELRELLLEGMQAHDTAGRLQGGAAYMAMDGTSMASPIVAGVAAAMIEANPALNPQQVKEILVRTADRLPGVRATDQGAGVLDAREAVEVALRTRAS